MTTSTKPGHVSLNGLELIVQDSTYIKELQTPFNPRFSTGEQSLGDLSFFQYLSMEDWSGGSGQEIFVINNRFNDCENVDVNEAGELKLAPLIEHVMTVNGPQFEHLNRPVEDEDAWPQITEWLGQAIIFNDAIEFDAGGVEFLEVYETDILQEQVIGHDTSGTGGVITNDSRAQILSITKPQGLSGDSIQVKVRFTNPVFEMLGILGVPMIKNYTSGVFGIDTKFKVAFRLYFGGDAEKQSANFSEQTIIYDHNLFTFSNSVETAGWIAGRVARVTLNLVVDVDFTVRIPQVTPGLYKLWTDVGIAGYPFESNTADFTHITQYGLIEIANNLANHLNTQGSDTSANANVLFFVQPIDQILVTRKNLYAPQLKATATLGSSLVGGRVIDGSGYIEKYDKQNEAVDRTLQLKLSDATVTPATPTYMQFIASNNIVIAAFDNRIYAVDMLTSGLTAAQRFTFIGQVSGDYVSGMALWNQRIYIASFSKSTFTSVISWTNGVELQGSYSIDGKFWITDIANFNGALFYSGGLQNGTGQVRLFPSQRVIDITHPTFDARVRTLNAGRHLYFGHSHGTGAGAITERGVSKWASKDLGENATNVVWDIEEVGDTVFILADGALFKTTGKYAAFGFMETSRIGANTPLIDKIWASVTVETEIMEGGTEIRVYARNSAVPDSQWFVLGNMTRFDGISKTFNFPPNYQAQWVELRFELLTSDTQVTPIIKRFLCKFVPATLNKFQWVFSVRATDGLKMLDGRPSVLSGNETIAAIWTMKDTGVVKFRDADENEYDVIITDIQQNVPILDKNRPEALISIELLET